MTQLWNATEVKDNSAVILGSTFYKAGVQDVVKGEWQEISRWHDMETSIRWRTEST